MSIVRGPRPKGHFTVICNDTLRDTRLSYRARGLLAAILSRPDDWRTSADSLAREGLEGRGAILTALRELEDMGYLRRVKTRDPQTGRLSQHSIVYDRPFTGVEKSDVGQPASGEPESETSTDKERLNTNKRDSTRRHKTTREDLVATSIAKDWWHRQSPAPAGKGAWFGLLNAVKAVVLVGWDPKEITAALDRINAVPSVAQLDRELRNPRAETWAQKKAREDREAADRIARRAAAEAAENAERDRRRAEEAAAAVPMPDEVRAKIRALTGRGGSK